MSGASFLGLNSRSPEATAHLAPAADLEVVDDRLAHPGFGSQRPGTGPQSVAWSGGEDTTAD